MLHDILFQLVEQQGVGVLRNEFLCGIADDMLAFATWKDRPFRVVLRSMIAQGTILRFLDGGTCEPSVTQALVDAFMTSEAATANQITEKMVHYVLQSFAYASGWCKAPSSDEADQVLAGIAPPEVKLGDQVVEYKPMGEGKAIGTMIPANMALPVNRNLNRIVREEGDLVDFLSYELQIEPEQIQQALAAEQIDGVAMAIRQMQVGSGFVISDATGIGKGRQLAALICWSIVQGCVPVFVTEKSVLFSDMQRDLEDIGFGHLRPFILNNDREARVVNGEGQVIVDLPAKQELDFFKEHHQLPQGYDFLALTYSQMSLSADRNWKLPCVLDVVKESYLFLDECHNATGTNSNTGRFSCRRSRRPLASPSRVQPLRRTVRHFRYMP